MPTEIENQAWNVKIKSYIILCISEESHVNTAQIEDDGYSIGSSDDDTYLLDSKRRTVGMKCNLDSFDENKVLFSNSSFYQVYPYI